MSGTPLRRSTRSASRDLAGTPAPVPPRSTRATSRASSRAATDGTSPLPSLLGRASTAYGSPTQAELANAITPNKNASGLFAELSAKRYPTDAHATSDLDHHYTPLTRKPTTKRKAAAATASRPSPIQEEDSDARYDQYGGANTTSNLGQFDEYYRATPVHYHARDGAIPPPGEPDRPSRWLPSLRMFSFLSLRNAGIALILMTILSTIALPWMPVGEHGGFLGKLKDRHHHATSSIADFFTRPAAPITDPQEFARLTRLVYNIQVRQDQLSRFPGGHNSGLESARRLASNYDEATSQVNFFSAKLGAMVDVLYSSPTRQPQKVSFFDQLFTGYRPLEPNEHITALLPWQEAGDCWCAPSARKPAQAKAQLAIMMPRDMIPTRITIEHHPQRGLLEPATTPRDMSVWIQIKDKALRDEIISVVGARAETDRAMPDDYVEIAQFTYLATPRDGVHIQTFPLKTSLLAYADKGLSTRKAIVRVDSNYGADYTCLYRVRMHGRLVNPQDPLYIEYHDVDEFSW